jgi:RHS repeat-associated protein
VHGSVATLNQDGNTTSAASAVYAYTPYGTEDDQADQPSALSKGDVLQQATPVNGTTRNDNPLNPFRYAAKRYDTGSQTLDTGTRRFDPGSGRFLQQDFYRGALDDLGLSTDPLNHNRYALAAANPIGYTESDGHTAIPDGGGGSSSPSPADFRMAEEAQQASTPPGGSYGGSGFGGARPPTDRGAVLDPRGGPFLTADQARDVILARCGQDRQCIRDETNKADIAAYAQKKRACTTQLCIRAIDQDLKYMLYDWTNDPSVFRDLLTFQENLHDKAMKYGSIVGMGFALGCIVTGGGCMVAGVIGAFLMADDVATCAGADADPAKSHGGCKYVLSDAITLYVGARNRSMVGRSEPLKTEIGGIRYTINPGTLAKVYEQGFVIMSTGAVVIPDDWGIEGS